MLRGGVHKHAFPLSVHYPRLSHQHDNFCFAAQDGWVRSAAGVQTGDASPGEAPESVGH